MESKRSSSLAFGGDEDSPDDRLPASKKRFVLVESPERLKAAEGVIPENTRLANEWFKRNLANWMEFRANSQPNECVPDNILSLSDPDELCKWICRYVQETRREDGNRYPPSTLRQLLAAFQRLLRVNKVPFNILDRSDIRFRDLHLTLDTVCVGLRKDGIGADVKHAKVMTAEDEETLWNHEALCLDTPAGLLRAVFFVVGLFFCLRGGQEHRDLRVEQFRRVPAGEMYDDSVYYEYTENGSKNYQGRFTEIGGRNKVVKAYAMPGSDRCPVRILDLYLSKLPPNPKAFYLQWMPKKPSDSSKPWFKVTPVGVNPLKNMVPTMCKLAGISKYTNHSLRATATTRMFNSGISEKVIAEFSGHKSTKALRQYERTSIEQEKAAGQAIATLVRKNGDKQRVIQEASEVTTKDGDKENMVRMKKEDNKKAIVSEVLSSVPAGGMVNCVFNFNF